MLVVVTIVITVRYNQLILVYLHVDKISHSFQFIKIMVSDLGEKEKKNNLTLAGIFYLLLSSFKLFIASLVWSSAA
jgi:hypothetical protein